MNSNLLHKGIGKNKHGENINLCGREGAAIMHDENESVTCNKCRIKLGLERLPQKIKEPSEQQATRKRLNP